MKKFATILLSGLFALLFTACGGGGGDSTPVPNTNQYDLRTFIDTGSFTINGEGTANTPNGALSLVGTYQSSYQGSFIASDNVTEVHLHDVLMILNVGGTTVTQSAESGTVTGYLAAFYNVTEDVYCETSLTLADITPVPTNAQVGYISDLVPLQCSDGSYRTNVIKLNDAGGGNAEISIISNTYVSQGGALYSSETHNIVVTPSMSMVNVELSGSIVSEGITFTLNSTSITQN